MRHHTTPEYEELISAGNPVVSLTPGTAQQRATFGIQGLAPVTDGKRNYALGFGCHCRTEFDPDAAGSAVNADKLGKVMSSWSLFSPLHGDYFPAAHTRGAVVANIIQTIACGYFNPQHARAQLPASTDTDITLDIFYWLPLSYDFLAAPHETAQWVGFFDQGKLEGILDVSTVLDGDYAGAVLKTPTQIRAWVEYIPMPDNSLGVPVAWRDREVVGGGPSPTIPSVGQESGFNAVRPGCGLAALLWLSNSTGIGLGGPDGVDNFTSYEAPWRGQKQVQNLDPLILMARRMAGRRVGPVAGLGTTIIADGAGWPTTMAATPNNRPAADGQNLFLPMVLPGMEAETSKFQRVTGNLKVQFGVTDAISASHRFVSCEFMEWDDITIDKSFRAMGIDPAFFDFRRKALLDNSPTPEALRYTRIVAVPKGA